MSDKVPKKLLDVASVWSPGGPFGSGRLIAPGLVLTSGHTVDYPSGAPEAIGWRVRLLKQRSNDGTWCGDPYEGERIWRGRNVDLALLKIGERTPRPAFDVVFSSFEGDAQIDGLEAIGYPQAAWDTERNARDYRVRGRLSIETVDWPFAFALPMADVPRDVTKWEGMSGAVVFEKDSPGCICIFGAVENVEKMFSNGKLYIARIAAAFDEPAFLDALEQALGEKPPLVPVRAGGGPTLPLDSTTINSCTEVPIIPTLQRFSPRNPRVPFLGRQRELAALDGFLAERQRPFAWWLIAGGGGAGKTRLALQLCLHAQHRRGWRAGFLPQGFRADVTDLAAWCPQRPTLIVADYVLKRTAEIRTLAARLARRDDLPSVRLLLLEREGGESFEREFLGSDQSDREVIDRARHAASPLRVPKLSEDDIWSLVERCPWRTDGKHLAVTRDKFLIQFGRLDNQRRVLVAIILADAMATSPDRDGFRGLEAELRELLRRDRDHLWPAELDVANRQIGETDADIAITFATMIDGLGLPELEAIKEHRGQALSPQILPFCAQAIGKPLKDQPLLGRLEPDLIGEFFALETLRGDNPFIEIPHAWMPEAAWRSRGGAMADFVTRATQDFSDHTSIKQINITVKGVKESWLLAAASVRSRAGGSQGLANALKMLLASGWSDLGAANALADFTLLVTSQGATINLPLVTAYFEVVTGLAHPEEPAQREEWARSVWNFLHHRATADPAGCWPLVAALSALARHGAHPEEPALLREKWVRMVTTAEPAGCRALLDALAALHGAHPEEPALRQAWAWSVTNFLRHLAAVEPAGCRALMEALAALHGAHPEEPALRQAWARSVTNFIHHRATEDPAGCRALLDALAALHGAHPEEPALRERWATSITIFVYRCAAAEPAGCRALLDALAALHGAHPEEPALRERWATSITNFIHHRATEDPAGCRALLDALAALHGAHPEEPALREAWATSVWNFLRHLAAVEPAGCRALMEALAALHGAHPEEPALRQAWAWSVTNFIHHRATEDPAGCRALMDALAALHGAHPEEPALRQAWARSVTNFIHHRATAEPAGCRALLENARRLVTVYPDEDSLMESVITAGLLWLVENEQQDKTACREVSDWLFLITEKHEQIYTDVLRHLAFATLGVPIRLRQTPTLTEVKVTKWRAGLGL